MNKTLQVLPKYKLGAVFVLGICTFVSNLALILFNGAVLFKFQSASILKQSVYSVSRI